MKVCVYRGEENSLARLGGEWGGGGGGKGG